MKRFVIIAALVLAVALAGCATPSSRMQESYKSHQYKGGPIKSVLVLGMAKTFENRKNFEILFSRDLAKAGLKTAPSFKYLPKGTKLDGNVVKAVADKLQMQTVMVVHYRGEERKMQDPKKPDIGPDYNAMPSYIPSVYRYVNRTDYAPMNSYLLLECNLYETKSQELIWTGHSELLNITNFNQLTDDLADLVVAQLKKDGLI
jgi:hypothetical protein